MDEYVAPVTHHSRCQRQHWQNVPSKVGRLTIEGVMWEVERLEKGEDWHFVTVAKDFREFSNRRHSAPFILILWSLSREGVSLEALMEYELLR